VSNRLNGRLIRLERRQPPAGFTFWNWIWGEEPPRGWRPPEWLAKAIRELPAGELPDPIESEIARACNYEPTVAELIAQNEKLRAALRNGTHSRNNGEPTDGRG
jgi:hypothetical protein